jgi:hypothetical protein
MGETLLTGGFNPRQRNTNPISKSRRDDTLFDVTRKWLDSKAIGVSSLARIFDFATVIIRRLKPPVNKVTPLAGLSAFPTIISTLHSIEISSMER